MSSTLVRLALMLTTLSMVLATLGGSCDSPVQPWPDNEQVESSTPPADTDPPADGGTTPPSPSDPGDTGNPNSPCADQTNIHVTYVNESSGRVGFVESFRDEANQVLAAKIYVLEPAGNAKDTLSRCITCPYQAGIRNVKYILNGVQTAVPYPQDLFAGQFSCGDNITFIFKANQSITTQVQTP